MARLCVLWLTLNPRFKGCVARGLGVCHLVLVADILP